MTSPPDSLENWMMQKLEEGMNLLDEWLDGHPEATAEQGAEALTEILCRHGSGKGIN